MTWQIITVSESHCVDRPFEVVDRARELLIANGWTAPGLQIEKQPEGIAA